MHWTTDRIRQSFLDFFAQRGHRIEPSASLVPKGDPTLLFTNAGMVPFKDYFLGLRTPPYPRVADCQKCLRISGKHNDLEAVGRDTYHHTFFEMLGNWSFGDYYKPEAIAFHWELATKVWGIDAGRLWATVYREDEDAHSAWLKLGVLPRERILRFDEKDNFWEMGETGPCGPCSEIHIDRGAAACDGRPHAGTACAVNVDGCARFIELANLVFIQYNRDTQGRLSPLPMRHVDTGTGLERVAAVLQSLESGRLLSNYDTDVFQTIIKIIEEWSVVARRAEKGADTPYMPPYGRDSTKDISYRAIADHARAIAFLMADGVVPGNSEREYVLRRIIRRAARHGRYLGIHEPFLARVHDGVVAAMGEAYPELRQSAARTGTAITEEEQRFGETLDRGLELIESERERLRRGGLRVLSGEVAFKLYDTYGFPLDLTQDLLRDEGIAVDTGEFERLMDEQRSRARSARKEEAVAPEIMLGGAVASRFVGYRELTSDSEVLALAEGEAGKVSLVVAETPFYPEGGGQVGDRGAIRAAGGALLEVSDTRKANGAIVHSGRMLAGEAREFAIGSAVHLEVDRAWRTAAMLNHSATHILHYALREVLGTQVHQAGSLVAPERLRFDFAHNGPVAPGDLATIEEEVNARIRGNAPVTVEEMAYREAIAAGALAFFGDKYGDRVRVVRMGDFSVELCGGTHITRTGDIGLFKLEAESGVASGVRRVEALTGEGALENIRRREGVLREIGDQLKARDEAVLERLTRLLAREKELERKLRALEGKLAAGGGARGEAQVREVAGIRLVTRKLEGVPAGALRQLADELRQKHGSAVVALASVVEDRVAMLVAVTPDLVARAKAGDLIKRIAPIVGGSGGGRADFAQAGGRDPSRAEQALEEVARALEER